jgi:hypothetical protein
MVDTPEDNMSEDKCFKVRLFMATLLFCIITASFMSGLIYGYDLGSSRAKHTPCTQKHCTDDEKVIYGCK